MNYRRRDHTNYTTVEMAHQTKNKPLSVPMHYQTATKKIEKELPRLQRLKLKLLGTTVSEERMNALFEKQY